MTYAELQAKVAAWINRTDLAAIIPDFITLTEERINRDLRVRAMESQITGEVIVGGAITPATDVIDVKLLWPSGIADCVLQAQALEAVVSFGTDGTPTCYAWSGSSLMFDGGGSVDGVLYIKVPTLSVALNNWVSTTAPSLYLFGALAEACLYVQDTASAQLWMARFDQVLAELNGNDNRRAGPLVARAR